MTNIDLASMSTEEKTALMKSLKADLSPKVTPEDPRIVEIVLSIRAIAAENKCKVSEVVSAVLSKMRKRSVVTPALAEQLDAQVDPVEPAAPVAPSKKK